MGDKAYKVFILSHKAFFSGQEGEEEARHLENLLPLLPSHGPLLSLSAY